MSRIDGDYDINSTEALLAAGRWERNSETTVKSKRGQQALREIEAALLALPTKRLAYETFHRVDDAGELECCVLGALAHHKGVEAREDLNDPDYGFADEAASWAVENLGLTFTLAWNLIYENDEALVFTPEQRYERVLSWVQKRIVR